MRVQLVYLAEARTVTAALQSKAYHQQKALTKATQHRKPSSLQPLNPEPQTLNPKLCSARAGEPMA